MSFRARRAHTRTRNVYSPSDPREKRLTHLNAPPVRDYTHPGVRKPARVPTHPATAATVTARFASNSKRKSRKRGVRCRVHIYLICTGTYAHLYPRLRQPTLRIRREPRTNVMKTDRSVINTRDGGATKRSMRVQT
jgi:hypothetical protein